MSAPATSCPGCTDRKFCHIRMEGTTFGGVPLMAEVKLEVWDSPNSAGVVIDAVRCAKLALGPSDRRRADWALQLFHEVSAAAVQRRRGAHPHASLYQRRRGAATLSTLLLIRHASCEGTRRAFERTRLRRQPQRARVVSRPSGWRRACCRFSPQSLLTSPRERCRETADALASKIRAPVEIDEDLDEVDFGAWTGLRSTNLAWDRELEGMERAAQPRARSAGREHGGGAASHEPRVESRGEARERRRRRLDRSRRAHSRSVGAMSSASHSTPGRAWRFRPRASPS